MPEPALPTLDTLDTAGRTVLIRSDLNVPLERGVVGDTFRISASLATIDEVRAKASRVIVASHLGRPKGVDRAFSMAPVAEELGRLGETPEMPDLLDELAAHLIQPGIRRLRADIRGPHPPHRSRIPHGRQRSDAVGVFG